MNRVWPMGITDLVEMGLAGIDRRHLEIGALEPAEISTEAVAGLAELVFELVSNSVALSAPERQTVVSGSFEGDSYQVSIAGRGVDGSDDAIGVLNRILEQPELALRLASAARLAARHRLAVEFVPGVSGSIARVTVPAGLAAKVASEAAEPVADPFESQPEPVDLPAPSEWAWRDSEAFLEEVFSTLRPGLLDERSVPSAVNGRNNVTLLRVRVPGESYPATDDDSPSTAAAEGAVDLRSALATYDAGRRSAQQRDVV